MTNKDSRPVPKSNSFSAILFAILMGLFGQ